MNSRNSFSSLTITQLVIHLTGALQELYADDTQEIQVMASGDDHDMKAVSLAQNGDTLTLEQSAAALSPLPLSARWLQVTVRIPRTWKGRVEIRTTSGSVHVRGLQVSDLSVESHGICLPVVKCSIRKLHFAAFGNPLDTVWIGR